MATNLKKRSTAEKKEAEAKKGRFVAVGSPFRFRVAPSGVFEDIEGVLEDGKLVFGIDRITEVDQFRYTTEETVRNDDGKLGVQKMERMIDAPARCREFVITGRLAEVDENTKLPVPDPDADEDADSVKAKKATKPK